MDDYGPLGDDEIDELDAFLLSEATPDDCMDIAMLDGFLTALAVAPTTLPPTTWMPLIWGGQVRWESRAQRDRIEGFVFRHADALLNYLRDDPETFEPLLAEEEVDGQPVPILDEWCAGFVIGMAADETAWQPLLDSPEGEQWLETILLYGTEDGMRDRERDPVPPDEHLERTTGVGEDVMAIMAYWLPARKAGSTVRREDAKVGRNDDCPCGSGKKYKKCCGAPQRLH